MDHEMIEEGKLAREKQKNIQAAAEFWADMRKLMVSKTKLQASTFKPRR